MSTSSNAPPAAIWQRLGRIPRSFEFLGFLFTFVGAAASFLLVAALVLVSLAASTSDNRIIIEKIEMPEALQRAGIGPERIELMLQEALQTLVEEDKPSLLTPGTVPNSRLRQTQLVNPMARLSGQDTQVVWAGHVFFADRLAHWLKSTFNFGAPQSLMSLRVSQLPEQGLDLHVHVKHSDKTQGYWALHVPEAATLLQPQSPEMQQFAFYLLLASEPERAVQLLIERDNNQCDCVTLETVRVLEAHAHRMSPYYRFSAIMATNFIVVTNPELALAPPSPDRELALLVLRLRQELKEAPWPSPGFLRNPGACESVDRQLYGLAKTQKERAAYAEDVVQHMTSCIAKHQDALTLERVSRVGIFMRSSHKQADELAVVRYSLLRTITHDVSVKSVRDESLLGVLKYAKEEGASRWPNDLPLGFLLQARTLSAPHQHPELAEHAKVAMDSFVANDCVQNATLQGESLRERCPEQSDLLNAALALYATAEFGGATNPTLHGAPLLVCPLLQGGRANAPGGLLCRAQTSLTEEHFWDAREALAWLELAIRRDSQHRAMVPLFHGETRAALYQWAGWLRYQMGADERSIELLMRAPAAQHSAIVSAKEWYAASRCRRPEPPGVLTAEHLKWGYLPYENESSVFVFAQKARKAMQAGDPKMARVWAARLLRDSREHRQMTMVGDHANQPAFEGHLLMGMALMAQKHFAPAARSLEKARDLRPYSVEAVALLSMAYDNHLHKRHNSACDPLTVRFQGSDYLDKDVTPFDHAASEVSDEQSGLVPAYR